MSTGKVLLGTLAGLAIGATAGILFAPEKGSTTRRQILDKGDIYADELKSKFDEFRGTLSEKFRRTKRDAEELVDQGKAKINDTKKVVRNVTEDFKHEGAAY
jgi:gas vesicle protein